MIIHSPIFSGSITQAESAIANLSGSFSGSFTGIGNFVGLEADSVEFNNVLNKPSLVSGSSQVSYPSLSNIPSGIISSSAQIDTLFNIEGLISGGGEQDYIPLFKSNTELSSSYLHQSLNTLKTFAHGINKGINLSFVNDEYLLGNATTATGSYVSVDSADGITIIKSDSHTNVQDKLVVGNINVGDEALLVSGSIRATGAISGQIFATNGVVSGSSQVDVMTTSNIPKLATTGSNIFIGTQIISGSLTVTGSATFTNVGPTILSGSISQVNLGDGNIIISDTPITTLNATAPLGIQNTIIGSDAGQSITDGYSNSFFGRSAGRDTTVATNNTFIGLAAGQQNITGSSNTFLGSSAGQSNKASYNTFVGMNSGNNNKTGVSNTFVGYQSGVNNGVGNDNTYIGNNVAALNQSGSYNTVVGAESLYSNLYGVGNSIVGFQALKAETGGSYNTVLGHRAGFYQPNYMSELQAAGYSIFIGAEATGISGATNQIVIGYLAAGNGTDTTTIGNNTTVATYLRGKLILSSSVAQEVTGSVNVNGAVTATSFNGVINATNGVLSGSLQGQLPAGVVSGSSQLTGSFARLDAPNTFTANQVISGSLTVTQEFVVLGSSSIQHISSSTLDIGTNLITVAVNQPSVRFGGLAVIDSGSVGQSGSFLYDSVQDEFIFVHRGDGTNITSSHFVLGPETYNNLGNETYLTNNKLPKGTGKEHLVDSNITDNGTTITLGSNTVVSGTLLATGTALVSGSSQITYANISSIPAGIVSGSSQIDVASTTGDIALGTRTSGNYVATITAGNGIVTSGATTGEGIAHTISVGGGVVSGSSQVAIASTSGFGTYINQAVLTSSEVQFSKLGVGGAHDATYELKVTGDIGATGDIVAYVSSDERLKNNVEVISNPIEKVQSLRGVTWEWNELASDAAKQSPNVGVIAQEVEKVLPQLVHDRENGFKGVDYAKLTGLLIEAIKEQQKQIDELKSRL